MTHAYHEGLEGYVPEALFHTGCQECEERAGQGIRALRWMDEEHIARAVDRAGLLDQRGAEYDGERAARQPAGRLWIDPLEGPFLRDLHVICVALRYAGLMR